jgi:hypothetical protein
MLVENKFSKYLLYAIGEIVLVVIGILIALQLNTWNSEQGNKRLVRKNSKILIENLEKDSLYIRNIVQAMSRHEKELDDFDERLAKNTATLDTLIKIARYEFNPYVPIIRFPNENSYKTMVLSGEINLFESELTQAVYDLYREHEFLDQRADDYFSTYTQAVESYFDRYSFTDRTNLKEGPLKDGMWKNVDAKDLMAKFNKLVSFKRLSVGRQEQLESVLIETSEVLNALRQIE